MNLRAGTVLGDRYALTGRIAAGGMGEVWAATDTVLGRTVAVKLLHPGLSQESDFAERFRAEARHTAALSHPNIATVFDYGEDDGTAYLVMELVVGQPLSQIIAQRGPLTPQETVSILIQAATALEAAHQGGVIHRDVKPANILITPDGTAKLTDFGISRATDSAPLTQVGQVLGTAQYLSPEQALGQSATAASDIYSLGVVGHEMLTGERPFDSGSVVSTALAHVRQPPPPLPDSVPIGMRDVIGAALAKDPADRPASAAIMAHALAMPDAAFATDASDAPHASHASNAAIAAATPAGLAGAPTMAMPALTSVMSADSLLPADPGTRAPGIRDWRSRLRPGWLLGAAGLIAVLAIFSISQIPGGGNAKAPLVPAVVTPTIPPSATPNPTPTTSATAAPTAGVSSGPGQSNPGKGNDNDDNGKKGK